MDGVTVIGGEAVSGFEPVSTAFAENFARQGDNGAVVCVYRDDHPIVDLWGGIADPAPADHGRATLCNLSTRRPRERPLPPHTCWPSAAS